MVNSFTDSFIHIGYPKAASTSLQKFLSSHPQVILEHVTLDPLVGKELAGRYLTQRNPTSDESVLVLSNEKISESIIFTGELKAWYQNRYIFGAWESVASEIKIDPEVAAVRVREGYGCNKALIVVRDQVEWLQSSYKYYLNKLQPDRRSFRDFCETPRGKVDLEIGYFDRIIDAYAHAFGAENLKVLKMDDLIACPEKFALQLYEFLNVANLPIAIGNENKGSSNVSASVRSRFPFVDKLPRQVRNFGSFALSQLVGERSTLLDPEEIEEIRHRYAASNLRVEQIIKNIDSC